MTHGAPLVLGVDFRQRAGSRLHDHERLWKLSTEFEAQGLRVMIARDTRLIDLYTAFQGYELAVYIDRQVRLYKPLRECVTMLRAAPSHEDHKRAWGLYSMVPPYAGRVIECKLIAAVKEKLTAPGDSGQGIEIRIEIHGRRIWRNDEITTGAKRSSDKTRPTK